MHLDSATHLHILEDDAVLAKRTVSFIEQAIVAGMADDVDILFTDTTVPMSPEFFRDGRSTWRDSIQRAPDGTALGVRFSYVPYVGCTTSYLVNRHSVRLICDILARGLEADDVPPIDMVIRAAVAAGELRAKCLFPFITSTRPDAFSSETTGDDGKRMSRFAMELLRHSFFVECDLDAAMALADRRLGNPGAGAQERLHSAIAGFAVSDNFRRF